ncbi:hypothetical protein C0993_005321 [Termitomyces sp. T159_Od127]|nr:hypothetical protein C0993_005321 [Termitomyces sp. T159_Od127]
MVCSAYFVRITGMPASLKHQLPKVAKIHWLWQVTCMLAEQGWVSDWVLGQMEGGPRSWAMGAAGRSGKSEEGQVKSEEEPSESGEEESALAPLIKEAFEQVVRQWEEVAAATMDQNIAQQDWDVALAMVRKHGAEMMALYAQVAELEVRVVGAASGEGAAVQAAEREAVWWWDWALLEALSCWEGVLCWAWEHWLLLDGASAAQALLQDGLVWVLFDLPMELDHGLTQLELLLAEHQHWNTIAPGSWTKVAVNAGESLPLQEDYLALLAAQMEMAMMIEGLEVGEGRAKSDGEAN